MSEFFFEIRSGEIPAPMQKQAAEDLKRLLVQKFKTLNLPHGDVKTFFGPRRLVAVMPDLAVEIPAQHEERRGPRVDAPDKAIQGFLKTTGKSIADLESRETPKGSFYFLVEQKSAQPTKDLLPDVIRDIIYTLPWPKSMTWSTTTKTWVRPLQGGCAVFDHQPLEFSVSMNEAHDPHPVLIDFNNVTAGHRFMAPSPFPVKNFADYQQKLRKAFVIVDQEERQESILNQIEALCEAHDLTVLDDKGLLDEVTGLVEWPVCLLGTIEARFMSLPPEVLRTTMRVHQRYFSVHKKGGAFAPHFIVAANIVTPADRTDIITGNERVLNARLSDAAFFYEQDCKKTLAEHGQKLEKTVFHEDLGTLAQKQKRLVALIEAIGSQGEGVQDAQKAATLCKADLMSDMVYEFPELQGVMGSYYAKNSGENEAVAHALYHHYSPKGPSDALPQEPASQLLALADRLDTLVGFFSIGLKPTGSKDPFALRRASLGIIRFLEEGYEETLESILSFVFDQFKDVKNPQKALPKEEVLQALKDFFVERLKGYWRDQGFAYDYIKAVTPPLLNKPLYRIKERLEALTLFVKENPDAANDLFAGYKRASNILKKEALEEVDFSMPLEALFVTEEERVLFQGLKTAQVQIALSLVQNDFRQAMAALGPLRTPIDGFFETVHVNDDKSEVRKNRLNLLRYILDIFKDVADFSALEG